jgi:predicted N-acetyltransferase YhbS
MDDLDAIASIEKECFPPAEAATEHSFLERLTVYPTHFLVLEVNCEIIGFINGMVTNNPTISDELFEQAGLHNEDGDWQAIFGLDVLPRYRRNGYAARLMERLIADSKLQNRKGCILTCKHQLIRYYEKFGYKNCGISASVHGGEIWYDMRLEF